ncbi:MAG: adenylate/guanylate cyclase domain-containing protein [Candidatus Manganitrophaceae bacterium]|nr:MAG: adenylate/guanylate cyclase domain-containing protein [Candidatus Manganitrophaceae bacterium]
MTPSASNGKGRLALVGGLGVTLLLFLFSFISFFHGIELKTYDLRTRWLGRGEADPNIVIVEIDDASLARLETEAAFGARWPFPRDIHAALIDYLHAGKVRAIAFDILFAETDRSAPEKDAALVDATRRAGNVYYAALLQKGKNGNGRRAGIDRFASRWLGEPPPLEVYSEATLPFPDLLDAAGGIGTIQFTPDEDGVARRAPLFSRFEGQSLPALSTAVAIDLLRAANPSLSVRQTPGALEIGANRLPLDPDGRMIIKWYGGAKQFRYYPIRDLLYSYYQLASGEKPLIDPDLFKNKIVLIGATAAGLMDLRSTPDSPLYPGVEMHATILQNLLRGEAIRPLSPFFTLFITFLLSTSVLGLALRLPAFRLHLPLLGVLLFGYLALAGLLFTRAGLWLPLFLPLAGFFLAYTGGVGLNYRSEGKQRQMIEGLFTRYVAPEVVRDLIDRPDQVQLGGVRKELTVLFSDIRGFTTLSERLPPEAVVAQLNEYLSAMVEVIFAHRGCLDKYIGDAIMAFWGAPVDDPHHAEQACRAALEMAEVLKRLQEKWRSEGKPILEIGIGINTGEMVIGNIGSERRMDYTVIGDHVNLASRLEGLNKEFGTRILISRATCERAEAVIKTRKIGSVKVKGKTDEVEIYALEGIVSSS